LNIKYLYRHSETKTYTVFFYISNVKRGTSCYFTFHKKKENMIICYYWLYCKSEYCRERIKEIPFGLESRRRLFDSIGLFERILPTLNYYYIPRCKSSLPTYLLFRSHFLQILVSIKRELFWNSSHILNTYILNSNAANVYDFNTYIYG